MFPEPQFVCWAYPLRIRMNVRLIMKGLPVHLSDMFCLSSGYVYFCWLKVERYKIKHTHAVLLSFVRSCTLHRHDQNLLHQQNRRTLLSLFSSPLISISYLHPTPILLPFPLWCTFNLIRSS